MLDWTATKQYFADDDLNFAHWVIEFAYYLTLQQDKIE